MPLSRGSLLFSLIITLNFASFGFQSRSQSYHVSPPFCYLAYQLTVTSSFDLLLLCTNARLQITARKVYNPVLHFFFFWRTHYCRNIGLMSECHGLETRELRFKNVSFQHRAQKILFERDGRRIVNLVVSNSETYDKINSFLRHRLHGLSKVTARFQLL